MVLRSIFRVPMGVFDEYRALFFKYPRVMNFNYMYGIMFFFLFVGKGYEKIIARGKQNSYELNRRARRLFIPYSLISFRWRFPTS